MNIDEKNLQHNIDKPNPATHKKDYTPRTSRIYGRDERLD